MSSSPGSAHRYGHLRRKDQGPEFDVRSLVGTTLEDRYVLEEIIGEGAMGTVFRAYQSRLQRRVAVKIPRADLCRKKKFLQRFENEALTMAKLVHQNIVQIIDVFISEDTARPSFIVMEYVEGRELDAFLKQNADTTTVAQIVDLFLQIAGGLDAAHERGIIHRDIKPSNIIVTDPDRKAKIMDFGVARIESDEAGVTEEQQVVGTPMFMAPEQIVGTKVTTAIDIFAFTLVMYRVLCGRAPWDARTVAEIHEAHVKDHPAAPSTRNPHLPKKLDLVLLPGLSKDPEMRPEWAFDLVTQVGDALGPIRAWTYEELFRGNTMEAASRLVGAMATDIQTGDEPKPGSDRDSEQEDGEGDDEAKRFKPNPTAHDGIEEYPSASSVMQQIYWLKPEAKLPTPSADSIRKVKDAPPTTKATPPPKPTRGTPPPPDPDTERLSTAGGRTDPAAAETMESDSSDSFSAKRTQEMPVADMDTDRQTPLRPAERATAATARAGSRSKPAPAPPAKKPLPIAAIAGGIAAVAIVGVVIALAVGGGDDEPARRDPVAMVRATPTPAKTPEATPPPTPQPTAAIETPAPTPLPTEAPRATPTVQPSPSPTPAPSPTATPLPTIAPSPTPEATMIAAVITPRPTQTPRPAASHSADLSAFDPDREAPVMGVDEDSPLLDEIETFLQDEVQRPCYRGMFLAVNNSLVGTGSPSADRLVEVFKAVQAANKDAGLALTPIVADSIFWKDRAKLSLHAKITGRPASNPDPNYRKTLWETQSPLTAWLAKDHEQWKIVAMEGEIPAP